MDYGSGGRLCTEEMSSRAVSDDSITQSRSCMQVENGTPSTSPPYWDTDDDDDDCGPKPSALFEKFTWKIENFSQINKRELRSNAFEVGGYKWYILIYPQGCDVCNHLSLFLCVANHDKLLPGWSHFAQFTIAVVNKDPKKSKYSDTLHRFCKKEHDWGWKKFIEISKVFDGFINDDSLVIKAQVQVIREKANRPFRCLDCQYRRELVRVYLSNVEQICRRFIEDRKGKLCRLIDDKVRWSSFHAFWLGMDERTKEHMSRDRTDSILKVVVKHFFVEKEVTSTLVMDSLYSGLKALESQSRSKIKKGKMKLVDGEEMLPAPIVYSENSIFVLSDDVLLLVERAALGPIPLQPLTPKDEKCSLNRTKDANSGEEFNKDAIERDERRLTEFGRRTLEFFILFHIFSKIDVAHKEAVALKRQEELIREEEAAEQAEIELKAKRSAAEKEKRAKKKQAKQRRNNRKVKDKARSEISNIIIQDKHQEQNLPDENSLEETSRKQEELIIIEKFCTEENTSDTSETADDLAETIEPELEDVLERNSNMDAINFVKQNEQTEKMTSCVVDDCSSTCSTESIPTVVMNGSHKGNSFQISGSPNRGKSQGNKDMQIRPSDDRSTRPETEMVSTLIDERKFEEEKLSQEEAASFQKELKVNVQIDAKQSFGSKIADTPISIKILTQSSEAPATTTIKSSNTIPTEALTSKDSHNTIRAPPTRSQPIITKQSTSISRPSSAPLIPPPRPTSIPITNTPSSTPQTMPLLSRSISATGRLGTDPSPSLPASAPPFVPHSYRNAITGTNDMAPTPISFNYHQQSICQNPVGPNLTFGSMSYRTRDEPGQVVDEFPHMDIIYDLLDEERVILHEATPSFNYHHNPHYQPNHYNNDQAAQFYSRVYGSSQVNQWPYGVTDLSMLNLGSNARDNDGGYGYRIPDYTTGVNGYMYNTQPGNGL